MLISPSSRYPTGTYCTYRQRNLVNTLHKWP